MVDVDDIDEGLGDMAVMVDMVDFIDALLDSMDKCILRYILFNAC